MLYEVITRFISKSITNGLNKSLQFANEVANGNLKTTLVLHQKDEVGLLATSLNEMVEKLRAVVGNINKGSESLLNIGKELRMTSGRLSDGATHQASALEEVASTMEA